MLFSVLLCLHVAGGAIALLLGPIPMVSRKGSRLHRRAGTIYAVAMFVAALAAFPLALMHWSRLLLAISGLTFFLVFCGIRAVRFYRGASPRAVDDASCAAALAFSVWLFCQGLPTHDTVSLFFGVGGVALALRQWLWLRRAGTVWLPVHLISMGAAYIATFTAFLVVNLTFLPKRVVFIAPTLMGTPLIIWAAIRHSRRVTPMPSTRAAALPSGLESVKAPR